MDKQKFRFTHSFLGTKWRSVASFPPWPIYPNTYTYFIGDWASPGASLCSSHMLSTDSKMINFHTNQLFVCHINRQTHRVARKDKIGLFCHMIHHQPQGEFLWLAGWGNVWHNASMSCLQVVGNIKHPKALRTITKTSAFWSFALLWCYMVWQLDPWTQLICSLEMSVTNYQTTLSKIPAEPQPQLHCS
jgi:hypothetical protein